MTDQTLVNAIETRASLQEALEETLAYCNVRSGDNIGLKGFKFMEEVGEFGESVAYALGYLPHKKVKEAPEGEAADVINVLLHILQLVYPRKTSTEISQLLTEQLVKKLEKWKRVETVITNLNGIDV